MARSLWLGYNSATNYTSAQYSLWDVPMFQYTLFYYFMSGDAALFARRLRVSPMKYMMRTVTESEKAKNMALITYDR